MSRDLEKKKKKKEGAERISGGRGKREQQVQRPWGGTMPAVWRKSEEAIVAAME